MQTFLDDVLAAIRIVNPIAAVRMFVNFGKKLLESFELSW